MRHLANSSLGDAQPAVQVLLQIIGWSVNRTRVLFSNGVRPMAGVDETMCSVSDREARLRYGGSVARPRFGLPRLQMNTSEWGRLPNTQEA